MANVQRVIPRHHPELDTLTSLENYARYKSLKIKPSGHGQFWASNTKNFVLAKMLPVCGTEK